MGKIVGEANLSGKKKKEGEDEEEMSIREEGKPNGQCLFNTQYEKAKG